MGQHTYSRAETRSFDISATKYVPHCETFRSFEYELGNYSQYYIRPPCGNVRAHMISCLHGPLLGCDTKLIHQVRIMGYVTRIKLNGFGYNYTLTAK